MRLKRKTWIILGSITVIILAAAIFGYSEYTRGNADLAGAKAEVYISSITLFNEFSQNEAQANAKYLNKVINTRGALKSIDKDHTGSISLALEAGDPMANVSCQLDARHIDDAQKFHVGDTISATGICTGMLTDVILVRCSAEKK